MSAGEQRLPPAEDERLLSHVERAAEALRRGDVPGATAAVDAALALRSDDPRARLVLGLLFFRQERFAEACAAFAAVVAAQPGNASARTNLGLSQLKRGAYAEAALELERALVLEPQNQRARGYLGLAYARLGDRLRAEEAFRTAGREDLARAVAEGQSARLHGAPDEGLVRYAADRAVPEGGAALRLGPEGVLCASAEEGLCIRRERWISVVGAVDVDPGPLPVRGRDPAALGPLAFASGPGEILIGPGRGRFQVIPLRSEVLYVTAGAIYAWTADLRAESGRAPGRPPLDALRLAGRGVAAVRADGPLVSLRVAEGREARVERAVLVGWTGGVRLRMLEGGSLGARARGEGALLLSVSSP